ncbi:MAG: aldehyde oxidase, partial [Acidobacteriota bacterium]
MAERPEAPVPRNLIGKTWRRVDGRSKVTGQTRYADDLSFPRMVTMRLHRSTVPHARIAGIDLDAASRMPGVLGFLTGEDMPKTFGILPMSRDENALALGKVRFVGDPVVAVAALSEEQADAAARAVVVHYEPLQTISSVEDALANPEPRIHDYGSGGNLHRKKSMVFGDLDAGFAEAD